MGTGEGIASMKTSRREFVARTTAATLAATALPRYAAATESLGDRFKVALSHYSLRAILKAGALDNLDFPAFTADTFGIQAIDLWEGGLPKEKLDDPKYLQQLRRRAEQAKTDLFLLMSGALEANESKREASLARISASLPRAKELGVDFVRIFLKAPGNDEMAAVAPCVEALKPLSDAAASHELVVAIEPGASPLTQRGAFLAKVAKELNHPACCLMPDFGKLKNNVYDGTEAMLPYTKTISAKMHSFDEAGNQPHFDYERLVKMIAASKYAGYLAIEWEGSRLKPVEGVKASQRLIAKSIDKVFG